MGLVVREERVLVEGLERGGHCEILERERERGEG